MLRQRQAFRTETIEAASVGGFSAEDTIRRLDAARWLQRVGYHYWRIAYHLRVIAENQAAPAPVAQNGVIEMEED
jgi:phosphate:Na+ symporter